MRRICVVLFVLFSVCGCSGEPATKGDLSAEQATDRLLEEFGGYHRVHTINNAAIVALALLWGAGDFSRALSLAVTAGLDTDCNGATVGSVMGAMLGSSGIPMLIDSSRRRHPHPAKRG